ncbi:SidA/IucD/PvdA family monooxygenase [Halobacillus litoralis]|uniref:L-lysine N6-monooxygenase MbtG n=1 Tax=Halobacillus litoralis TaxID=45668 RepID=A0A845DM00_9BACI|nr:lysine N(6)-hydroxylase/L-ornithine N(5)-oxygenase family protein [Halobacillus litoralis]MYL18520.1 SidA/IucD/PvdA family monooxygenase [Halobacillus litoralis]MYL38840.1 SidA/IucD/PvdA family monooxygenase [Halobacillus litoralis]
MKPSYVYDVIGVGLGPFNLGMAALLDPVEDVSALFFEKEDEFNWHPGMLIEGTTLQVPFFADLVSMVDVRSEYSFLHYLQEHQRLYHFYFLEKFHIPRKEYNAYCRWVSSRLSSCRFGYTVTRVNVVEKDSRSIYEVGVIHGQTGVEDVYYAENVVLGIGTQPYIPAAFQESLGDTVFHTSEYLEKNVRPDQSVAVLGSGQSSAEVFLDLARSHQDSEGSLQWYTRSNGFFPMEYSKLGLEYFSPDYIDFFYELPQEEKDALLKDQGLLYKGISAETIADIYDHLYEQTIGGASPDIHLQAMTELTSIQWEHGRWLLNGVHRVNGDTIEAEADVVVLGTGYQPAVPAFLQTIQDKILWDEQGRFQIEKTYELKTDMKTAGDLFVQNGELHSHGVGAPDLGLGAHRNAVIINKMAGRDVYPVQVDNVFQTFGTARQPEHSSMKK